MDRLVVGNWKQNPTHLADALALAAGVDQAPVPAGVERVVCPPAPYLADIAAAHPGLALGAQDVSADPPGAHTGEVGAEMLKDLGVRHAIVGHSERRAAGESDAQVAAKAEAALASGIAPIFCVGEPREVRDRGPDAVREFLVAQLASIPTAAEVAIAYEPIWAIGSGTPDNPVSASEVASWIVEAVSAKVGTVRVLYGGSVAPENAASFLAAPGISGLLVGGASLDAGKFAAIVSEAAPPYNPS